MVLKSKKLYNRKKCIFCVPAIKISLFLEDLQNLNYEKLCKQNKSAASKEWKPPKTAAFKVKLKKLQLCQFNKFILIFYYFYLFNTVIYLDFLT